MSHAFLRKTSEKLAIAIIGQIIFLCFLMFPAKWAVQEMRV